MVSLFTKTHDTLTASNVTRSFSRVTKRLKYLQLSTISSNYRACQYGNVKKKSLVVPSSLKSLSIDAQFITMNRCPTTSFTVSQSHMFSMPRFNERLIFLSTMGREEMNITNMPKSLTCLFVSHMTFKLMSVINLRQIESLCITNSETRNLLLYTMSSLMSLLARLNFTSLMTINTNLDPMSQVIMTGTYKLRRPINESYHLLSRLISLD